MNQSTVVPLRNRMTEADYEAERQRLRDLYGDGSQAQMAAKRDQAMAELFHRSGWTQEELAAKEGVSQRHIGRRLLFGRFLNFRPDGLNPVPLPPDLTENKFRAYWEAADKHGGNERQRFDAVVRAMTRDNAAGPKPSTKGIPKIIGEAFADGKWHDEQEIVDHFRDHYPDEVIREGLLARAGRNGPSLRIEREKDGRSYRYRIFNQARTMISVDEIREKLLPLIKDLIGEGKKNMVTMSPGTVLHRAQLLKKQLDEWEQ